MNRLVALPLLLLACEPYGIAPGTVAAPQVAVRSVASVELDAIRPTDVLIRPDGSLLVLDGYRGRVLTFSADGVPSGEWGAGVGRAVRISNAADGGVWAAVPGAAPDPGLLVHLDANGVVDTIRAPRTTDDAAALTPVDVVELGGELVIADRTHGVMWLDLTTARATRQVAAAADGKALRRPVDLLADTDGVWAVDSFGTQVVRTDAAGVPGFGFGRPGLNVGQFARPTAIARLDAAALVVTDATLGAAQVFEADGDLVGVLAVGGASLKLEHPVAVAVAGNRIVVLEAMPARLQVLELEGAVPAAPPRSLLKTPLVGQDADPAGAGGESCLSCHDGLVLDSREVWDPARKHHPVGVVPEKPLPEVFELDAEGKLACTTCHSPHGVVDSTKGEAAPLVRHQSEASPFTRLEKEADALCLACHQGDAHVTAGSSVLGEDHSGHLTGAALRAALERRADDPDAPAQPTDGSCLSCHAMHGASGDPIMRDPGDGEACLGCHPAAGRDATNHPLGRVPGSDLLRNHKDESVVLAAGGGIGCLTCHDLAGRPESHLVRTLDRGKAVCLDCHTARKDLQGGGHADLVKGTAPTCIACHDVHGGARAEHFLTTLSSASAGDPRGCLSCHGPGGRADKRGVQPGKVGHPVDGRDADGEPLTCLSCHDAHEAERPTAGSCTECHQTEASAAARGGHGKATCIDCHAAHESTLTLTRIGSSKLNPASGRCLACHAPTAAGANAPKVAQFEHPAPMFKPDGTRWTPLGGLPLFDKSGAEVGATENGDLTCQSCHLVHGPDEKRTGKLRRAEGWQTACASCHGDEALVLYQDFHTAERTP